MSPQTHANIPRTYLKHAANIPYTLVAIKEEQKQLYLPWGIHIYWPPSFCNCNEETSDWSKFVAPITSYQMINISHYSVWGEEERKQTVFTLSLQKRTLWLCYVALCWANAHRSRMRVNAEQPEQPLLVNCERKWVRNVTFSSLTLIWPRERRQAALSDKRHRGKRR